MIEYMPPLVIVVCMARNGVIGCGGKLPWNEPEDLKHFRRLTTGHSVIMGRATYDSIGRPLPNRRNIVITRTIPREPVVGIEYAVSVQEGIHRARETDPEPRVIGGSTIYWAALPWTTRIYMTVIQRDVEGDACFPVLDEFDFVETDRREDGHLVYRTLDRVMQPCCTTSTPS